MERFSRREKKMLFGTSFLAALFLVFGVWWSSAKSIPNVVIPTPVMPVPNAFDDFVAAGNAYRTASPPVDAVDDVTSDITLPSGRIKKKVYPPAAREAWLRANALAFVSVRRGLKKEYRLPPEQPGGFFRHYSKWRHIARGLRIESHARQLRGDWRGAMNSTLDCIEFGNKIPRGGKIIDVLVGYALQAIGRREAWSIVSHLDAPSARAAALRLQKFHVVRVPLAESLLAEKYYMQSGLVKMMRDNTLADLFDLDEPPLTTHLRLLFVNNRVVMNNFNHACDAQIANARRPYVSRQPVVASPATWSDPITNVVAPVFAHVSVNDARSEAGMVLLMTALALRAYNIERGAYPQSLQQLVPRYLSRVPLDPFGTKTLNYSRRRTKYFTDVATKKSALTDYTLYSLGPDGDDDNGTPLFDASRRRRPYMTGIEGNGDIVANINDP